MIRALALLVALAGTPAWACTAVDWLSHPLPAGGDPMEVALELAYPGTDLDRGAGRFSTADGQTVPYRGQADVGPMARLQNASIGDQFYYTYPLDFDLSQRRVPWVDPGRLRNDAFFRALYFQREADARALLNAVRFQGQTQSATFQMTTKHCVHAQLTAALAEIQSFSPSIDRFFADVGGSFNWRVISGTDRLSAHSFGIAVDFSTRLGGYWRWSGAAPGQAVEFDNRYPPEIVQAMERYGFIWGGKWHHFDGMHFEYRPELIVMARLLAR